MKAFGYGFGFVFGDKNNLDSDTIAFLNATGITDPIIINAINRLVLNWKGKGNLNSSVDFWTNSKAIYPLVGGSASTNMYNLKDPRNSNAAYRLTFSGGWTHNANGMTGNGINSSANTFLNPSTEFSLSANSYGVYIRNNTAKGYDIGAFLAGSPSRDTMLAARYTSGNASFSVNNQTYRNATNTDSRGTFVFSKNGATTNNLYKNKISIISSSDASIYANDNFRIGGGGSGYIDCSDHNYAFAFFSTQGLSLANTQLLTDIIDQFQIDLGRNI